MNNYIETRQGVYKEAFQKKKCNWPVNKRKLYLPTSQILKIKIRYIFYILAWYCFKGFFLFRKMVHI